MLCLSSKDPRREIPIYLRLGIRPDHIRVVEKGPEAAAELRRNLKVLGGEYGGVRVEETDLLRFLNRTTDRFDAVNALWSRPRRFIGDDGNVEAG